MKLRLRVIAFFGLSVFLSLFCGRLFAADRPNIVFILCDDLGINDLHCYGRQDHHTPNLDRLAGQGMRFTSAYCAQSICSPSRAAILTGKTPARLHLTTFLPGRPDCVSQKVLSPEIEMQVPLSDKMLPRYFKEAGYVTAAIGKWHVGGKGFGPLDHGFDVYHEGHANTKPSATEGGKGEYDLTAFAERFIETNKDHPFLVYLAHNAPHIPYDAQPERIANNRTAFEPVYAGMIETIDDTVGRLLAKLDELKLTDHTIVVFTSDNGGLHVPELSHRRVTHNTPFRAGKGFDYEGGLRIPLIVRWPGHVAGGTVVDSPVINTDWLPTLLELSGQPVPGGLDGVSLAPLLTGHGSAPERSFFWHFPHYTNQGSRPSGAMRDGNWALVEYYDEEQVELYDLAADIRESRNVATEHPDRVATMRAALAAWRKSVNAQTNRPNPNFDPAKFRELYRGVDASRFDPATADPSQWEMMWAWRKEMDAVVRGGNKVKESYLATPDAAWDAVFTRTTGWTGGDVAGTVDLGDGRVLWLFGDSWIGDVVDGRHKSGSQMVNNSVAIQSLAGKPDEFSAKSEMKFYWQGGSKSPSAWIVPSTTHIVAGEKQPDAKNSHGWYWPTGGGIVVPGPGGRPRLLMFLFHIGKQEGQGGIWAFKSLGGAMATVDNVADPIEKWQVRQCDIPFAVGFDAVTNAGPNAPKKNAQLREISWGVAACRYRSDENQGREWLYIYGIRNETPLNRQVVLARAKIESPSRFDEWQFYTGRGKWSATMEDLAPIAEHVTNELSVERLPGAGQPTWIMVHSEPPLGGKILVRTASRPDGPWTDPKAVYSAPEVNRSSAYFAYAAKGHLELSRPDELLITYVVNAHDFGAMVKDAEIYRPRFIRVPLNTFLPPH